MHPRADELRDLLLGRLPEERAEEIGRLIDDSPDLQRTLHGLREPTDTLLTALRHAVPAQSCAEEPYWPELLERLRSWPDLPRDDRGDKPEAAPPQVLRDYRLLERLGRGGMGTVYKAIHTRLDKTVAIKILAPEYTDHPAAAERFRREMKAVGKLQHPHIVAALDAGACDGHHYLVMELIDGVDLHQLVRRQGPLAVADACEVIRQAALGLEHLRQNAFVHRDIKPSNLILSQDGNVKLLDLGLALLNICQSGEPPLTATGKVMGTLDYMAPEQFENAHDATTQSDLYSLGCTFWFLLAGRAPFEDTAHATPVRKMAAHTGEQPNSILESRTDVPAGIVAILDRLLAKSPKDRFATPGELAAALAPLAQGGDLASRYKELAPTKALSPGRRFARWGLAGAAAAVVLGTSLLLWHAWGGSRNGSNDGGEGFVSGEARPPAPVHLELQPEPVVRGPGEPLSFSALVSRPAPLPGVTSWTLESRAHRACVKRIAWRPDGKVIATACTDGTIRFWDSATKSLIRILVADPASAEAIAWSPDGWYIATIGVNHAVCVHDAASCCRVRNFVGHTDSIRGLDWSADGQWLASTSADGTARVWDLATGQMRKVHELPGKPRSSALCWHPLGRLLALAAGNTIRVVDGHSGQVWATLVGHTQDVRSVAWSPDKRSLASGSYDGAIRIWDARTYYQTIKVLSGHADNVKSVAWSPDSRRIASCGADHSVMIWNAETGICEANHPRQGDVGNVAWSPDGKTLGYGNWRHVARLWGVAGDPTVDLPSTPAWSVRSLAWSPDGARLAAGGEDEQVRLWEAATGRAITSEPIGAGVTALSWPKGSNDLLAARFRAAISVFDGKTASAVRSLRPDLALNLPLAFSPDANAVAWTGDDKQLRLSEVATSSSYILDTAKNVPHAVAWSSDSKRVAAATEDRCIRLFSAIGEFEKSIGPLPTVSRIVAWSPGNKLMACGCQDGAIHLADVDTGKVVRELPKHEWGIRGLAWSPDGGALASSDYVEVRLWDAGKNTSRTLRREFDYVDPLCWSPDGTRLAYGVWGTNMIRVSSVAGSGRTTVLFAVGREMKLALSDDGHVNGAGPWEDAFVYVVETESGQETLTPAEFATKYGFRNDPSRIRFEEPGGQ